jgi:hypothetical protein
MIKIKLYRLFIVNIIFLLSFNVININSLKAENDDFDMQKCMKKLVKDDINTEEAKIWCNYQVECLEESQAEGLPKEAAKSVCDCTINDYMKKYNIQEFQRLTTQAKTNPDIKAQLREVGEICFENLLYEE